MYEFYDRHVSPEKLKQNRKDLKILYDAIPETTGCMQNIAKSDGCGAWCCATMVPQVLLCEFKNTWNAISTTWGKKRLGELFLSAVKAYLDPSPVKGCIFFDRESKMCQQHSTRPFNCRIYAQTPDEDFKPRIERLRVLNPKAEIKDQCNLCTTVGEKPTKAQVDGWFQELMLIESDTGVTLEEMNDKDGGSYRTYHDHILLKFGDGKFLEKLTFVKNNGTEVQRQKFISELENQMEKQK